MAMLLWWIPLLPLLGFVALSCVPLWLQREPSEKFCAVIGVGSVGLAALSTAGLCVQFLAGESRPIRIRLWRWLQISDGDYPLQLDFAFHVDALTLVMLSVITGVGFLIHLYSAAYMRGDDSYRRYFAYLNLFVFSMLILVLADNLVLLYLGWEGVGLCSYLLIGFWYRNPDNGRAARKAFIVTRVGDTALLVGLFLLLREFHTLALPPLMNAVRSPGADPQILTLAALLLLGGALGKSAQLPLQTWLPDAMAGPTPVSALIHAATMVTAGVYLVARCHELFLRSEVAMLATATLGTLTLLLAGLSALAQTDIKRVLAYSTISQLGYMFLALGAGAFSAAIFHLVTHAFFKALLFLAAGVVILSLHHEQDMRTMGGLRKKLPLVFAVFVVGCAALAALPLTSGFFSKEQILAQTWDMFGGTNPFWLGGVTGALVTGMYSARLLTQVFFGAEGSASRHCRSAMGPAMTIPLVVLALLALVGGALPLHLDSVFGSAGDHQVPGPAQWVAAAAPVCGILVWLLIRVATARSHRRAKELQGFRISRMLHAWSKAGWGFDRLYQILLVEPIHWAARANRNDFVDKCYAGISRACLTMHVWLSESQSGLLRSYLTAIAAGVVGALCLILLISAVYV
ncbi:NADH-quinone oxidoreductase subunit L [Microbulbifer sp. SA54]|uniref:NADH-quinone oxidoreductase subunit L n=1 Tax=Microbulbifer sp. SA54 TaxID=3401577 RepID=UPI003AB09AC9